MDQQQKQDIIAALAIAENGTINLTTPVGRVDVLTAAYAIQVEPIHQWQAAIALAAEQADVLPGIVGRAHLYGSEPSISPAAVEAEATTLGVTVTWEAS